MGNYSKFYNLATNPFGETPDPDFYYDSPSHNRALNVLDEGVRQGRGFALLTGEVGTGKTLISRILLSSLSRTCNTALVLFPRFNEKELLQTICEEFEIPRLPENGTSKDYLNLLNEYLIESAGHGKRSVLIIDEAQSLPLEALEAIRLISNLETKSQKLLHIVLVAQPEFRQKLASPEIRQLAQRVTVNLALDHLSLKETERYMKSRLEMAGNGNFVRFDEGAVRLIHQLSGGIPRRINQICEKLIIMGQSRKIRLIDERFARAALKLQKPSLVRRLFGKEAA